MQDRIGLVAASAILRTEAQVLYPKDNKKDEECRSKYIEDRLHAMHQEVLASLQTWEARQRWYICNRRWRIFSNDPFIDIILKVILIPKTNLWMEYLETDKPA